MILSDNFKTTRVEARFIIDMDKKEVPLLELLSGLLIYTSKKYNTRKDFINKCKDLYDLSISSSIKEDGKRTSLNISMSFLDDKYSYDNLFEDSIKFLKEVIYNPNVKDDAFDEESYKAVNINITSELETIKEDKGGYSKLRLFEIISEDEKDFISRVGKEYKEIIDNANSKTIYEFYKKVIDNSMLNIIVFGNIDFDKTEKIIKDNFNDINNKSFEVNPNRYYKPYKKVLTRFESDKSSQAKLNIACFLDDKITPYEKEVIIPVYNLILGGFANSVFFKNIREKHSLCYYIISNFSYYDNLFFIRSGINKDNYDKVISLVKKDIKNVAEGKISESLVEEAKETYISSLKSTMDYPALIVNNFYDNKIDNISLFEDRIENIKKVTLEDVKKVAKKVKIDAIYLFGGDSK